MDFLSLLQGGAPQSRYELQMGQVQPQQELRIGQTRRPNLTGARQAQSRPLQMGQPRMAQGAPGQPVVGGRMLQPTGQVIDIADEGGAWNPQVQRGSAVNPMQGGGYNHQGHANQMQGGDPLAVLRSLLGL